MGFFSYLCKVCNDPINFDYDTNTGEHCTLYLLKNGRIIETMTGQYNNYGCVYDDNKKDVEWQSYDWTGVCRLHFFANENCGLAAVHTDCLSHELLIETQSKADENQGNGDITHTTEGKFSIFIFN